jgi:hypothetical protein
MWLIVVSEVMGVRRYGGRLLVDGRFNSSLA